MLTVEVSYASATVALSKPDSVFCHLYEHLNEYIYEHLNEYTQVRN